jgi:hypothetical protein
VLKLALACKIFFIDNYWGSFQVHLENTQEACPRCVKQKNFTLGAPANWDISTQKSRSINMKKMMVEICNKESEPRD